MAGTLRLIAIYLVGLFWSSLVVLQVVRLIITKRGKFFAKKNRTVTPKCLEDSSLGKHHTLQVKDAKLHYVESGPQDGTLMVMLHGFPEFWYSWRHQIRAFNKKYRVVAVDLRGYGGSSKPDGVAEYTVVKIREDIRELIEVLGKNKGCILLGHDWGGAIAWSLAAHYPQLVQKVIIMNCPHMRAMMKTLTRSWKQFMKSWYMFLVNLPYLPEWYFTTGDLKMLDNAFTGHVMGAKKGAFTPEDLEAFKYTFNTRGDFTGPMNYIRAAIRGLNRSRDTGGKVSVPLLLVWGTKDGALSNDMAKLSGDYAEQFTLKYVEGASHWVQQDEPQIVNKCVTEFIEK